MHGGPRWFFGDDRLVGYRGPGLGAGVGIEANFAVISYYIDLGADTTVIHGDGRELAGTIGYIAIGGRVGWM